MTVRGTRSIFPSAGKAPTGIFSAKGAQKTDSTAHFKHQDVVTYSKGSSTRSSPKSTQGRGVRTQGKNGGNR